MRSLGTSDRLLSGYRVLIFIRKECSEFNVIDKSVYGDRDQPRGRRDEMRMGVEVGLVMGCLLGMLPDVTDRDRVAG